MTPREAGMVAYEAYAEQQGWVDPSGAPMPRWDRADPATRETWREVAKAVMRLAYRDARRNRKAKATADA